MKLLQRLQQRWKLDKISDVIIVLIVFASTGFTVMFLKRGLLELVGVEDLNSPWFSVLYYIFILPIYNVILLFYGLMFGKFQFFWQFEVRMWNRMLGRKPNEDT